VRDFFTLINPQPLFLCQLSLTRRNLRCNAVPVVRAADDAKPGTGLVYITEDSPTVLRGVGTKFTTELAPRKQVMLGKSVNSAAAEIVEVISDTEARLKKEFGGESGKGTGKFLDTLAERDVKGLEYKILPFVDQGEMYGAVYARLKEGGCIGIFPEGTVCPSSLARLRHL
jgi:glycerol-3-phosphate O-acyltransferase / dihydroxyacetone phosphate acyltransferase